MEKGGGGGGVKHFTNKPIFIHRSPLLPIRLPRDLGPHLLHVLQHHVAMPVEGLHAGQELAVVTARDEDLIVAAYRCLEDREGAGGEFILF